MKKTLKTASLLLLFAPGIARAEGLLSGFLGLPTTSANSVTEIVKRATSLVFLAASIVAFFVVLWGAFLFLTTGGDEERVKKAQKVLLNGGMGLLITIFARVIVVLAVNLMGGGVS